MKDPLAKLPGYALRRAATTTSAELSRRLAELGTRTVDSTVMMLIESNPGVTASALGRELDIQRANMVPLLKRLEDAGFIDRVPIDRKSQGVSLTDTGKAKLADILKVIRNFEDELTARIPAEHRDHLIPALNALWR